jgi:hypothetical protein
MKKLTIVFIVLLLLVVSVFPSLADTGEGNSCWGQASAVFAQTGAMGEHSSQQPTPRLGLHNLAVALYEAGMLPDDSLQALGVFVSDALGLSIDACME